jgi:hypothetical protein
MSDENLGEVLDESYRKHKREVALRNLGERTHLTLEKLAKLVGHKEHGETVKDITLQELIDVQIAGGKPRSASKPSGGGKKTAAKKTAKTSSKSGKKPAAKKTAKKATKKPAAKKTAKKATKKGPKADKGRPKPRLDYETGKREVLAAVKAAGSPVGRSDIEKATGYTGVQVRTFAKELAKNNKISILGSGGRSTRYAMPA